jgi:hypothetical protein
MQDTSTKPTLTFSALEGNMRIVAKPLDAVDAEPFEISILLG